MSDEQERRGRPRLPVPEHGTRNRYQHRSDPCHCDRCRAANAVALRAWRWTGSTAGTVDDAGTPVR